MELTLLDPGHGLWTAEFEVAPDTDSLLVSACAYGFGGQLVCEEEFWSVSHLSAEDGGIASNADGSARLLFPPGALPFDAVILSGGVETCERGYVFECGPAGVPLRRPAALNITVPSAAVPGAIPGPDQL